MAGTCAVLDEVVLGEPDQIQAEPVVPWGQRSGPPRSHTRVGEPSILTLPLRGMMPIRNSGTPGTVPPLTSTGFGRVGPRSDSKNRTKLPPTPMPATLELSPARQSPLKLNRLVPSMALKSD